MIKPSAINRWEPTPLQSVSGAKKTSVCSDDLMFIYNIYATVKKWFKRFMVIHPTIGILIMGI